MEILRNLFYGFPDLWGGGVAHSVMILALVITLGLSLGKLKVKGVSLGLAWILFIGLIFGHYSLNLDAHLLHFLKEFGLILFVYSIGLEVGPGFFSSFKDGGKSLNSLTAIIVALSIVTTLVIYSFTGTCCRDLHRNICVSLHQVAASTRGLRRVHTAAYEHPQDHRRHRQD